MGRLERSPVIRHAKALVSFSLAADIPNPELMSTREKARLISVPKTLPLSQRLVIFALLILS
jgi:hypothetical protein